MNLALLASLALLLAKQRQRAAVPPPALTGQAPIVSTPSSPAEIVTQSFRWSDLESSNDYRAFVANLRAIGCPEASVADIVRGNVDRAFSWERSQLRLDGSGTGPWSWARETDLINDLLGNPNVSGAAVYAQNAGARSAETLQAAPQQGMGNTLQGDNSQVAQLSDPQLYAQNSQTSQSFSSWPARSGAWNVNAGLTAASVNPSFGGQGQQSEANGNSQQNSSSGPQLAGDPNSSPDPGSYPGQPTVPENSANDQSSSDDPFTKSAQDIMAQQQEGYYEWYEPQVIADTASDSPLVINPDAFHSTQ